MVNNGLPSLSRPTKAPLSPEIPLALEEIQRERECFLFRGSDIFELTRIGVSSILRCTSECDGDELVPPASESCR